MYQLAVHDITLPPDIQCDNRRRATIRCSLRLLDHLSIDQHEQLENVLVFRHLHPVTYTSQKLSRYIKNVTGEDVPDIQIILRASEP